MQSRRNSEPYLANGVVYVESEHAGLYALDATTGHKKWEFYTRSVLAQPVVNNGIVYAVGKRGLFAFNESTGAAIWEFTDPKLQTFSSPVVAAGRVYLPTMRVLYALDAETGRKVWEFEISQVYRPVSLCNDVAYVVAYINNATTLYALGVADGVLRWQVGVNAGSTLPTVTEEDLHAIRKAGYPVHSDTGIREQQQSDWADWIDKDEIRYSVGDYTLSATDLTTNNLKWQSDRRVSHLITAQNGLIYACFAITGPFYGLYALNEATGECHWSNGGWFFNLSTPVTLLNETIYAGDVNNRLYALNALNGETRWTFSAPTGCLGTGITADRGYVYMVSLQTRTLYALDEATGAKRWEYSIP